MADGDLFQYWRKPNADLWQVIWEVLRRRAPGTVRAKWAKGRATEEHVRARRTKRADAWQNAKAGHGADDGRLLHSSTVRGLPAHYRQVLTQYQQLVAQIRTYMLLTIKAGHGHNE